ncbi:hypothetical protein MANES_03G158800v8 [Manihot esculenta]|uniref:Uncharacterized protein n=1 Tax=Manihot esculenta TaxID=3983 RepID=A0ACB7I0D6_MANES|nr:hypothetical protein MANES_03G158800v8 [Manihot esculenta]
MGILFSSANFLSVYPKVKVRTQGQGDQRAEHHHNWNSLLSFKDIQFLLLQDSCFPVKEYRDVFAPLTARIPETYVPKVLPPTLIESASEELDKKSNSDEEDRPNIRASAVPRPRAVVSSPVIGNKNRVKAVRPSALMNHHSVQSRHAQCKVAPSQAVDGSPLNTWKPKDTVDNNLKGKKLSATEISSQRRNITNNKPSSARIPEFCHTH